MVQKKGKSPCNFRGIRRERSKMAVTMVMIMFSVLLPLVYGSSSPCQLCPGQLGVHLCTSITSCVRIINYEPIREIRLLRCGIRIAGLDAGQRPLIRDVHGNICNGEYFFYIKAISCFLFVLRQFLVFYLFCIIVKPTLQPSLYN